MYGFIIKKNFCDGWDNLFSMIVANVCMLFAGAGLVLLNAYLSINILVQLLLYIFSFSVMSILMFAYGEVAAKIANFNGVHVVDFFKAIPGAIKDGIFFGILNAVITWVSTIAISYYFFQTKSMIGLFFGAMICWIDIFVILAFQWFIPIRSLMHNNFKKCLKKCFLIFFDNKGFTILTALYNLVLIVFSVVLLGFAPSFAGLIIANTNALRIRLYKYDYLEEHPELETRAEQKQIPWEELIYDDREALGPRKFKSFIFPWKDD